MAMTFPNHFVASTSCPEARFYIGTYTNPAQTGLLKSTGIYVCGLDLETGRLSPVRAAGTTENPSFIALSPNGKFLYAAVERPEGAVAAFRVEAGGGLALLNEVPASGAGTCHVSTDATGRFVFAANYGGAGLVAFQTALDGSLEKQTAFVPLSGSGPNPVRQTQSFGHSIYQDRTHRFVYACDLGSDHVWVYQWDAGRGTLTPNDPAAGDLPAGSGPRHLAFNAQGTFVYVCNELNSMVTAFECQADKGMMKPIQTVSLLGEGMDVAGFGTAEIVVHPSGQWLYVSNRDITNNGRDFIAVLAIAPNGQLTLVEKVSAQVKHPRSFDIDPSGRWLVVAGKADHRIAVLKINTETGTLEATAQSAEIPAPTCILFAPQG